jgi:hypothetical protein
MVCGACAKGEDERAASGATLPPPHIRKESNAQTIVTPRQNFLARAVERLARAAERRPVSCASPPVAMYLRAVSNGDDRRQAWPFRRVGVTSAPLLSRSSIKARRTAFDFCTLTQRSDITCHQCWFVRRRSYSPPASAIFVYVSRDCGKHSDGLMRLPVSGSLTTTCFLCLLA